MTVIRSQMWVALGMLLTACGGEEGYLGPPVAPTGQQRIAMRAWVPGSGDNCSVDIHNGYSTIGPDGKQYPTWHPPVDPATGCSFGHEHGRDPHGSDLYGKVGDLPFGYLNETLDTWDPGTRRHEDHVGHKVEWENNLVFQAGDGLGSLFTTTCDVLVKLHQGTHSRDAFTNNLHELIYSIACTDGTEMHIRVIAAIGTPGEFVRSCDGTRIIGGTATPANSPAGSGRRRVPDRTCIDRHFLVPAGSSSSFSSALHESWEISTSVKRADGHTLASFNPYFQAFFPSRFHDPAAPNLTGRPIAACNETESNGDRARGTMCSEPTQNGSVVVAFDDPRSPFNGVRRKVDINSNRVNNLDGPNVWYTDPFGKNGSATAFPGSVRQWIARVNNDRAFDFSGPTIGGERSYGASGTHAPN